jgi:predicted nucleic-acid-binding protein
MKGLDTNVVVRYLTQDDAEQWAKVRDYFEETAAAGETCLISNIVLCETVWVLKVAYKLSRVEIANLVEKLLRTDLFAFEQRLVICSALAQFRQGRADFSDYLIGEVGLASGCTETVSFGQKLSDNNRFRLL